MTRKNHFEDDHLIEVNFSFTMEKTLLLYPFYLGLF
ncbi:hypothetical protein P872_23725 [Rhodonellum psychrophilum GCM71 = DSM 17998]|uniref:Uncharacterized protein n=1 Tax=Rhodonellum psychrophilum GCM71 = DSM 17998 TaxID=1123057 RepID=U5C3U0_9BACT|nr:hypothetical protein P872_23725 [Rhodonellum psychrophilum GCM71 = DSM 17998]